MVFSSCDTACLQLEAENTPQVALFNTKNESHHHINALHRQNASFNLFDHSHNHNNNSNHNQSPILPSTNTQQVQNSVFISSNGYYGYVNNFSVVSHDDYKRQQQQEESSQWNIQNRFNIGACTDSSMSIEAQEYEEAAEKRKRLHEVNEFAGCDEEPFKRCKFESITEDNREYC